VFPIEVPPLRERWQWHHSSDENFVCASEPADSSYREIAVILFMPVGDQIASRPKALLFRPIVTPTTCSLAVVSHRFSVERVAVSIFEALQIQTNYEFNRSN
jgi:hypothetical protein